MIEPLVGGLGISSIATYEPPWALGNDWFGDRIPRKFLHHTGIESRRISLEDEVTMGVQAVRNLQRETGCDLRDCVAMVFVSPSFVPLTIARRYLGRERSEQERLQWAAQRLVRRLEMPECRVVGLNWFCSGYSKAIAIACRRIFPWARLGQNQYLLLVTAGQISRITDYGCNQTAALFGDLATATMLIRNDNHKHPVHFDILYANAEKQPVDSPFFDFHLRKTVRRPSVDGNNRGTEERLVFSLDGMGIAEAAPRAMSCAVMKSLVATGIPVDELQYVVPHQAGTGIVRFTVMKLEGLGIKAEVINGLTQYVGNVSSCSIPYALRQTWQRLSGIVACPTAAVGRPGVREVSQGCILLRATPLHERQPHEAG